jgi:NAD(P)-dependent dehydrogenase (short-subunit alcohol dehydrogenase family)
VESGWSSASSTGSNSMGGSTLASRSLSNAQSGGLKCGATNAAVPALAVELGPMRVNAVAPGVIRTPQRADMDEMQRQFMFDQSAQQLPLARLGEVTDTARAYL